MVERCPLLLTRDPGLLPGEVFRKRYSRVLHLSCVHGCLERHPLCELQMLAKHSTATSSREI